MSGITKETKKLAIKKTRKNVKGRKIRKRIISAIKALDGEKSSESELANIFFDNNCSSIPLRIFPGKRSYKYFKRWLEKDYNEVYKSVKFSNVLMEQLGCTHEDDLNLYETLLYSSMLKMISDGQSQLIKQMSLRHNDLICEYQNECGKAILETNEEIARLEVKKAKLKLRIFKCK